MKNIAYIESNRDGTIGGSYYCLLEIVKHLDRSRYNPIVIFHDKNTLIPEFEKYAVVIVLRNKKGLVIRNEYPDLYGFFARYGISRLLLSLFQKTYNLFRYVIPYYLEILSLMKRYRIDLVHMNDQPLLTEWLLASRLFGARCISHLRGNLVPSTFQKRMMTHYERVISISDSVTAFMKKQNVDTSNFMTINDGIDIGAVLRAQQGHAATLKGEFDRSDNGFLLGLIGNIKQWKGQHVAVEAVRILRKAGVNVTCLVIGAVSHLEEDVTYFARLRKLVADYGLDDRVLFTGFRNDVPGLIAQVDLILHTSIQPEPFGRVILEGMLSAKPVIATAHGGPLEIIEDGVSGYLVPPDDPQTLAETIRHLLSCSDLRQQVGAAARRRVENKFTIASNVRKIESVYASLLTQARKITTQSTAVPSSDR